jgi:putative restriction endonuclease
VDALTKEWFVRRTVFSWLDTAVEQYGDILPSAVLRGGVPIDGERLRLMGPQGIFKPAALAYPLSITTAPVVVGRDRPYEDEVGEDGLLLYRYRGADPRHHENVGLRETMRLQLPLVYFHGVSRGEYVAQYPVFVTADDPGSLTFTVAVDDPSLIRPDLSPDIVDMARRAYVTRLARQRIHQVAFRQKVLRAYKTTCAVCRLAHSELLDAAHILPDTHPSGEPVVPNGMAMCKLHHAAFDRNILGVRPDLVVEIRSDVLDEIDGPMLLHGLQELNNRRLLTIPRREFERPSVTFLEERYERFRAAG